MSRLEEQAPGLMDSARRLLDHGVGLFHNRVELLAVEFKEEKTNLIQLLFCIAAVFFFAMMTVIVLTATVILMFREEWRVYATGGFFVLYLLGAIWSVLRLKAHLRDTGVPFPDTINEFRKDREWLQSK